MHLSSTFILILTTVSVSVTEIIVSSLRLTFPYTPGEVNAMSPSDTYTHVYEHTRTHACVQPTYQAECPVGLFRVKTFTGLTGKVRETFLSVQAEKYELGLLLLHRLGALLCLLRQQQNL